MSIMDFIEIVGFGLTCFSIGYTLGKDNHKSQNLPPSSGKLKRLIIVTTYIGLTVYR